MTLRDDKIEEQECKIEELGSMILQLQEDLKVREQELLLKEEEKESLGEREGVELQQLKQERDSLLKDSDK